LLSGAALAVLLGIWAAGRGEAPINEKEKKREEENRGTKLGWGGGLRQ